MDRIIASVLLILIALNPKTHSATVYDENNEITENVVIEESEETAESFSTYNEVETILYFISEEYIKTGSEYLEKLIPEKRVIICEDVSLEEGIIRELINGSDSDDLVTIIPNNLKLLSVEVIDETAFLNFSKEGLNGGSLEEYFTIKQIVDSLFELDNIEKVQFLVEGEKTESLMGHIGVFEPFERQ